MIRTTTSSLPGSLSHLGLPRLLGASMLLLLTGNLNAQSLTITALAPNRNALKAPQNTSVTASFNQALRNTAGVQQALQVFSQQAGGRKAGTATVSGSTLTFAPTNVFKPGELVSASLTKAAQSADGTSLARPQVLQFTTAVAPSAGTFDGGAEVSVGRGPRSARFGDVDGDGDLDILTATSSNTITIRLNNGAGSYSNGGEVSLAESPQDLALGDVDGDGDLDIVTVGNTLARVSLNNGSGRFTNGSTIDLGRGLALSVTLGDLDGDGDLDLACVKSLNGVSVRFNNGNGIFTGNRGEFQTGYNPQDLALGDIDNDGDLDLLTANNLFGSPGTVGVRLNDGTGEFYGTWEFTVGRGCTAVTVGDVDSDGDLDIITANNVANTASIRLNDGSGVFTGTQEISVGIRPTSVAVGDVDGDGDLDLLTSNGNFSSGLARPGTVSVRLNDGNGAYSGTQEIDIKVVGPYHVVLGDVDNDGDLDFATTNIDLEEGKVSVRLNQPAAATPLTVATVSPGRNVRSAPRTSPVAVSFNQALSAAAGTQQALRVFSQQAGGQITGTAAVSGSTLTFSPAISFKPGETVSATLTATAQSNAGATLATPQVFQFTTAVAPSTGTFGTGADLAVGTNPQNVALGDVDGDGDLDILTANNLANSVRNGTVTVRLNNGDGTYTGRQEVTVGRGPYSVKLADIDSDGDLDLLTANSSVNTVSVRLNDGAGNFSGGQELTVGLLPHDIALGDVDGDGDLDLLAANYVVPNNILNSIVSVRLNDGTGTFSGNQEVSVGTRPLALALGDVDNDGDLDFVTANSNNITASVRLNNGQGTFGGGQEVIVGFSPQYIVLGDIDGDNDLDLLTANYFDYSNPIFNYTSSNVGVRLNDGDGNFRGTQQVSVGRGATAIALGDADGDGDLDLFATNNITGSVGVRLNDGEGTFRGAQQVDAGDEPASIALGDLDGNGTLDLAVANYTSNNVSVRLNQTAATKSRVLASTAAKLTEQLTLYPNPAHDVVRLQLPIELVSQRTQVSVLNALGQVVLTQTLAAEAAPELSLSQLPAGLYNVQLQTTSGIISKQLVVK